MRTRAAAAYSVPESLRPIQDELERVAQRLHQTGLASSDGRFPVYVLMTTRSGLQAQYGAQSASLVEQEMKRVVAAIQQRRDWHAMLFYADQPSIPDLRPARYNDPWSLKLALADLDAALGKEGEMIGAVLIVGGPEVIPFHHLPNPVDDADDDVPSDNPYSTRDENYFIPEWPVGRLPGGCSSDPASLISGLAEYHPAPCRVRQTEPQNALVSRLVAPLYLLAADQSKIREQGRQEAGQHWIYCSRMAQSLSRCISTDRRAKGIESLAAPMQRRHGHRSPAPGKAGLLQSPRAGRCSGMVRSKRS